MIDINKIGQEVAALIKGAEKDKEKIAPMLRKVWSALEAKEEVNGVKSKGAWAKKFGITLRYCQYIVKDGSRKRTEKKDANRVRGGFLGRIAEAKKKVGDIQRAWDAPYKDGEVRNVKLSELDQISPILESVYREFEKLIAPNGYEVMRTGNGSWVVQGKDEQSVITHIKYSPRKTQCMTRFINRKFKGLVFAKDGEEVTCPDCIAIRDKVVSKGTLQEAREKALAKNRLPAQLNKKERLAYTTLKATFDKLAKDFGDGGISAAIWRSAVTIHENTNIQRTIFRKRSGHFMNFMKQVRERMEAEIRDHETRMSEPTQVAIVINDPPVTYDTEAYAKAETWSQKRCIIGSPENVAWSAELKARRELQEQIGEVGNLDGDDEEDEIEEQL
jgi:hypothetical protein